MNVRHVPNLKKNILSLVILKAPGYKFYGVDGGIKVTNESMTIVKEENTANLYKLTGSIIVSDASGTTK